MRLTLICVFASCLGAFALPGAGGRAIVRHVSVLGAVGATEIEITTSEPITPAVQLITGPDRLVLDFPGAVPDNTLHKVAVDRTDLKGVRIGLFSSNPPVTRIVLDLSAPRHYQLFPSGRTLIVKLGPTEAPPTPVAQPLDPPIGYVVGASIRPLITPIPSQKDGSSGTQTSASGAPAAPVLRVKFQDGKLSISADKATLSQVLFEVHQQTGADIPVPAGAEQEQVVAELGPAPPREVLTSLLAGSPYDFVLVGADKDPNQLRSVQLTRRGEDAMAQPEAPPAEPQPVVQNASELAPVEVQPEPAPEIVQQPVQPDMSEPQQQPPN